MPKLQTKVAKKIISGHVTEYSNKPQIVAANLPISDRATKRVIAPFVRIIRKGQKPHEAEESKHFSFFLQRKPSVLIRDLSSFLSDSVDLPSLLHETADVLKSITKAAGVTLYMMDPATNEIYQSKKTSQRDRYKIRWKIQEGTTTAAYVAYKKNYVLIDDIIEDDRFPEGIGYETETIKSVLCVPVVTPDGECFAVIELYRQLFDEPFSKDDLKLTLIVTGWMGAAIHQNSRRLALQRQQELNDYLLDLTKCFFGESVVMEKMLSETVNFAKVTLNAEKGTIFIIDRESGDDLVADMYDDSGDGKEFKKSQKVRFSKERGIASLVARSGITVNVKDAYKDVRFNKEIDQKTGFITRSILCMPIVGVEGILGVVQVVNKRSGGHFTSTDESLFRTFCVYCALALRFTKVQNQMQSTRLLNNCFLKMIHLQMKPCIHDIMTYNVANSQVVIPVGFDHFSWHISTEDHPKMPQFILYMFLQLIKNTLNPEHCIHYILSVKKFYRRNPYHNFEHALNVVHCMYLMLKRNIKQFNHTEIKALMIAALCHDVDHPGFTNNFLESSNNDLANLYENSCLENHQYYVSMLLLDYSKILTHLSKDDYSVLKYEIKEAIIATDPMVYFSNKINLEKTCNTKSFNWTNETHRSYLKGIMMMVADLSGMCKPFLVSKRITDSLYAECYLQGDLEKEMGLCPLSMMDRDKSNFIPEDQVTFLSTVVLPCLDILRQLLPNTDVLYNDAKLLVQNWQDIIDVRGKKCWRQDDSIVEKRYNY
ncbi:cAMP and cAMP-inhibited cGMP 3',5'-cyclic phosphodiesterase 10A-like [Tribolium madens]|uniref:cAMP and cAMP-inhibited cGMP 3',5'-cyclic phosphodiesterase 10A-like n=1 Tax=Tribolium madens TaxID=41895 RepID=UPI001CF7628B|nr:cAMP and cAMP-inhibited cGMP 3',5'-cyclic phosphodiesterase 10A-like [Tribolium madens]